MASEHEFDFIDDPINSPSCTVGSNRNLSDSILLQNMDSSNQDSKLLPDQHHGNNTTVTQNLQSSCQEQSTPFNIPQPGNSSNIPESSQSKYHQPSENVSGMVHDMRSETRFQGNEDSISHIQSGTEIFPIPNSQSFRQDLYVPQPSEGDGLHLPTTQCFDAVQGTSQQLISEKHNSSENRSNTIQEMHTQTELGVNECNWPQSPYQSMEKFSEMNMNRPQAYDSITRDQTWNEPVVSQIPYSLPHQPTQSVSNIGQTPHSTHAVLGNKVSALQAREISDYLTNSGESGRIQDLPVQSFQHSVGRSEDIQSSHPQGLRQSESDPNKIKNMDSTSHPESIIKFNQGCELSSSTRETQNQAIAIRGLLSLNRQQVESETCERLNRLPQMLSDSPQKRHLPPPYSEHLKVKRGLYTIRLKESQPSTRDSSCPLLGNRQLPPSYSEHQFKRESYATPHAESQPSTSDYFGPLPRNRQLPHSHLGEHSKKRSSAIPLSESQSDAPESYPLPDTFLQMDSFMNRIQFMSSNKAFVKVSQEYVDLRMLQHPYSNLSEYINRRGNSYPPPNDSVGMDSFAKEKQNIGSEQEPVSGAGKESVESSLFQPLEASSPVFINILVFGSEIWTKCLLKALAGTKELVLSSPYSFVFRRNITRCGISMKVSVWKIDDLSRSSQLLESCLSNRITIMYVMNEKNLYVLPSLIRSLIVSIRQNINRNIPFILVNSKHGDKDLTYKGYKLKAKLDLSAYLEYLVSSREDLEAVMLTAIDVSLLCNF